MTIAPAVLNPGVQLGASVATLYTTPANTKAIVRRAVFTNIDTVTRLVTVYRVISGGSAGVTNTIIAAYPVAPGQDYAPASMSGLTLGAGETIQAFADVAAKVNAFISGFTA